MVCRPRETITSARCGPTPLRNFISVWRVRLMCSAGLQPGILSARNRVAEKRKTLSFRGPLRAEESLMGARHKAPPPYLCAEAHGRVCEPPYSRKDAGLKPGATQPHLRWACLVYIPKSRSVNVSVGI